MPLTAILLALAALAPFIVCGLGAVGGHAPTAALMLGALVGYAALLLAFNGGMFWALGLRAQGASPPARAWLLGGAAPVVLAWVALGLHTRWGDWLALPVLIFGHAVAVFAERRAGWLGQMPRPYATLRWLLGVVAVGMLTTVFVLRLSGSTIVF